MKKLLLLSCALFFLSNAYTQLSINNYKYVIVPSSYEFLGEKDKYQLNSLTKFLFNKYGFEAYLEDEELPQDLVDNRCLAMVADLEDMKGFLKTKVQLHLRDCAGQLVMSSKVGDTKEKMLDKSFQLALRDAFETFMGVDYTYQPKTSTQQSSEAKVIPSAVVTEETISVANPVSEKEQHVMMESETMSSTTTSKSTTLYAQPIANGYQIVDTEPKKVMILYHSGIENVFMVDGENAIVYKKNDKWIYAYVADALKTKELNIKF